MTGRHSTGRLAVVDPELDLILTWGMPSPLKFTSMQISCETCQVEMRDGVRLATDVYRPPGDLRLPSIAVRTPYGRSVSAPTLLALAQRGYVIVAQDCRGTGDSEPDTWDYYVYEREDSFDLVEWIKTQAWFDGFIGGCGGSYVAQTQWCMALHPQMSTIVPEVGGLGVAYHTAHLYMFLNAYARVVGKGSNKVTVAVDELEHRMLGETLAGGYFNEALHEPVPEALLRQHPQLRDLTPFQGKRWLWQHYTTLSSSRRAELVMLATASDSVTISSIEALSSVFGHAVAHDAHMFAAATPVELCRRLHAPALMITGWYDWGLNDALESWHLLTCEAEEPVASRSRLIITPAAHNVPGYHEGRELHPELERNFRTPNITDLLVRWYAATRDDALDSWPKVLYYLMGANEWRASTEWPPAQARPATFYLGPGGSLATEPPSAGGTDRYSYDPERPTPTVGGSIVSYVYVPGSADVSDVQARTDVLTYTTQPLDEDFDLVGPLRLILFASSSATDTDFVARLSDVFPDGRAIQLQSGLLRARYRNGEAEPALLEPGRVYRLEIDLWATANRFKAGHRLRVDICSADFPRFDRNTNLGGQAGAPIATVQTVFYDPEHQSQLRVFVL